MFDLIHFLAARKRVGPLAKQIRKEIQWRERDDEPEDRYLYWVNHDDRTGYKAYVWLRESNFSYGMFISRTQIVNGREKDKTIRSMMGAMRSITNCVDKFVKTVAWDMAIELERKKFLQNDMKKLEGGWKRLEIPSSLRNQLGCTD